MIRILFFLLIFITGCGNKQLNKSQPKAKIIIKQSAVHAIRDGQKVNLKSEDFLYEGDEIISDSKGMAKIILDSGIIINIKNNTQIKIGSFGQQNKTQVVKTFFNMIKGIALFIVPPGRKPLVPVDVETDNTTVSVKGTEFLVAYIENSYKKMNTMVLIFEGVVNVKSKSDNKSIDLHKLELANIGETVEKSKEFSVQDMWLIKKETTIKNLKLLTGS